MKKLALMLAATAMACGGSDAAKTDSAAPAAAPAALTVNDLTGSYAGTSMMEASDSVLNSWTSHVMVGASGGAEGTFVNAAAPKDTVKFTQAIEGDSVVSTSAAFTDATLPKGTPPVKWRAVGRASGMEWTGTVTIMIAANDSVLQKARWKATRTP